MISISIVVPVYSGVDYLRDLVSEIDVLKNTLSERSSTIRIIECIFVNDDAKDGSYELLLDLKSKHDWVYSLCLSKNFGQHPATIAGILHCSGEWIVTIDEDLQHNPHFIPRLLQQGLQKQSDIIYAQPLLNRPHSATRNLASATVKRFIAHMSGVTFAPFFNSYRLIRGNLARAAASGCSKETYYDVALSWFTERVTPIKIPMLDQRTQCGSQSGYNFQRLYSHAERLVTNADVRLMHFGAKVGFIGAATGLVSLLVLVVAKLTFPHWASDARGWASTVATILLVNGLLIFQAGLTLRFLTAVTQRLQGRPAFFEINRDDDLDLATKLADELQLIEQALRIEEA